MATHPAPGEGPVRPVSVSLQEGGTSADDEALIQRHLERVRLRELIEVAQADHGPVDQAPVEAKRAVLRGDIADSVDNA